MGALLQLLGCKGIISFYKFQLYNVPDMSPATMDALADRLLAEPKLMSRYLWNKKTGYGSMPTPSLST